MWPENKMGNRDKKFWLNMNLKFNSCRLFTTYCQLPTWSKNWTPSFRVLKQNMLIWCAERFIWENYLLPVWPFSLQEVLILAELQILEVHSQSYRKVTEQFHLSQFISGCIQTRLAKKRNRDWHFILSVSGMELTMVTLHKVQ